MNQLSNVGVLLPTRGVLVYSSGKVPKVELVWQMAETVERLGYDSVWVGDSITSKPRLEPLTTMAAIAARTRTVKIGTAVMLTALRHPVHLAHAISTIDNVSGGRTILGVGAGRGDNPMYVQEHQTVGVPIKERAQRMEDGLEILRELWTQPEVTSGSQFYPLENVALEPKPIQQPVPIWISSNLVKRGLWRVAKYGDAWITNTPSTDVYTECLQRVNGHAEDIGRDPNSILSALYISVNLNTEEEALREGGMFMQDYYGRPYEAVSKQLLCVFGQPQKCAETMLKYRERGVRYFIVRFASRYQMEQLDVFTDKVLPYLL